MAGPLVSRIDRYVLRQLAAGLVASTAALVALIWLTQSLRFVELVVNHGLSMMTFLELTGLLVPQFVALILPITTFVVVQFVYQRLNGDRELTVMRAAGLSPLAVARPGLVLAGLVVLASYGLNVWAVPASYGAFREFQFEIRNRMAAFLLQEGVFTPISDKMMVYVRSRGPDGTLHGILVDDQRGHGDATILAEKGRILNGPQGPQVLLINGSRQEIDHHTGQLDVLAFRQNVLNLASSGKDDAQRYRDAAELSIPELLHPDPAMVSPRDRGKFLVEAHRRLSAPLTALSFALIALFSSLGGAFRRHGGVLRPIAATLAVVGLLAFGLAAQDLAARQTGLVPLIWIQATLPGLVAGWLLFGPSLSLRRAAPRRAPRTA